MDLARLIGRYDGSVPTDKRKLVRDQVQVLLTNPNMFHLGILQHHESSWAEFFANFELVAMRSDCQDVQQYDLSPNYFCFMLAMRWLIGILAHSSFRGQASRYMIFVP